MRLAKLFAVMLAASAALAARAVAMEATLEVDAGDADRSETPVAALIALPAELQGADLEEVAVQLEGPGGTLPGQLLPAAQEGKAELWFLVSLGKGQRATYKATIRTGEPKGKTFAFDHEKGHHLDLLFDGRKITRFMTEFDPDNRFPTAKPFTHVFDAAGEYVITSPGGSPYPHHRGIFLGYKVGVDGKRYDFWHVRNVWQRCEEIQSTHAGPVLGRMTALVTWEIKEDTPVVSEQRTLTVYRQSKPEVLLDFVAELRSTAGDLDLGGDPEHAGCQFRPHFDVAKNKKETQYVYPPDMHPRKTKDMPWAAIQFMLRDARFNVAHLNHPSNPEGTVYSAYRDYGRFGAFPRTKLPEGQTLTLRYRIFVRQGEEPLTVEECQSLHKDFVDPPEVTVGK
ncbi:MAG: DUF6807 family protein [Candidatus Brocadiia bacterium]